METKEAYDKILERVLNEYGLKHWYIAFGEYDHTYDAHQIGKVIQESKKFIGVEIPFTGKTETTAQIVSEPKQAKSQHTFSRLKYEGLEVHVTNDRYSDDIRKVCERLETELKEPVKLVV